MRIIPVRLAFAALISAAAIAAPLALAPATAQATAVRHVPFTQAAFAAAQAAGKPILIDVYAPWCPVCRAQQAPIAAAQADPANADLVIFRLDFDGQKTEQRPLRVTGQATLIAFRGRTETGRLQGNSDRATIARLVASTRG